MIHRKHVIIFLYINLFDVEPASTELFPCHAPEQLQIHNSVDFIDKKLKRALINLKLKKFKITSFLRLQCWRLFRICS